MDVIIQHNYHKAPQLSMQVATRPAFKLKISLINLVSPIIPSLQRQIDIAMKTEASPFLVIDLSTVYRVETAVAQFLESKARELQAGSSSMTLIFSGVTSGSGVETDLARGGMVFNRPFERTSIHNTHGSSGKGRSTEVLTFQTTRAALYWCKCHGKSRWAELFVSYLLT